ncbi:MAG: carboxyl transferase domain-containing protein [Bacteriovoracaceae bacterium]
MTVKRIGSNPKDWIDYTFDESSVKILFHQSSSPYEEDVIAGVASINGSPVAFYAQNPKVDRGFISSLGAEKIIQIMDKAQKEKMPILAFLFSAGVSISEGITSGQAYAKIINRNITLSGHIPQIAVVMGSTMGAAAYSATLMDLVIMNKSRSYLMVTSPSVVEWSIGERTTLSDLGGSEIHSRKTGIADFVEANIPDQLDRVKKIVTLLQDQKIKEVSPLSDFPPMPEKFVAWNMEKTLQGLVDNSEYHLYREHYGKSMLCAFARIGGVSVGIIANQSNNFAGAIGVEASLKSTRFLRICDAYGLPLISLIDVPGFMPGTKEEQNGLLRSGANFCSAMLMRVPRISIVMRRCYGAAAFLMLQNSLNPKNDLKIALPDSKIAIMGYAAARSNIYSDDPRSEEDKALDYFNNYESPHLALKSGLIDEVLEHQKIRERVATHLQKHHKKNFEFKHPVLP